MIFRCCEVAMLTVVQFDVIEIAKLKNKMKKKIKGIFIHAI